MIEPQDVVGEYTFMKLLGGGSFGQVWKVRKGEEEYAIKVMLGGGSDSKKVADLENIFADNLKLENPFLVKYHKSFRKNPTSQALFIVMELCREGDLSQLVMKLNKKEGIMLTLPRLKKIFVELLLGLYELHVRKILHGDIKLENIFIDSEYNIKIGDFGCGTILAKTMDQAKTMVGTLRYMSPEMFQDNPYDSRADVWALGVVFYVLCTLEFPFPGDNWGRIALSVVDGEYQPIHDDIYPSEVIALVEAMLQKEQSKRPYVHELLRRPEVLKWAETEYLPGKKLLDLFPPEFPSSGVCTPSSSRIPSPEPATLFTIASEPVATTSAASSTAAASSASAFTSTASSTSTDSSTSALAAATPVVVTIAYPTKKDHYEGTVSKGVPHGKGVCVYSNGNRYEGDWVAGKRWGRGECLYVREGLLKLIGRLVTLDEGSDLRIPGGKYVGDWVNDMMEGNGRFSDNDGGVYDGQWKGDKREGKGTYTWEDGDKYEGDYRNDKMEGRGAYTWVYGDKYEGDYRNEKKEGKGIYTWANGDKYKGDFKKDKVNGQGVKTSKEGKIIFSGKWKDNKPA